MNKNKAPVILMTLEDLTASFENLDEKYEKILLEGRKQSEMTRGMRNRTLAAYTAMSEAKEKLADARRSAWFRAHKKTK